VCSSKGPRQLKTLLDGLINRGRFRMGENRTWSLANGQGGTKERIKKKEGECKECGSLQGARKGNWELRGRGRLYSAKEGVRLHALPHRPRNGRSSFTRPKSILHNAAAVQGSPTLQCLLLRCLQVIAARSCWALADTLWWALRGCDSYTALS
jgi:hypothetical protein